jgi:hypothetical protein
MIGSSSVFADVTFNTKQFGGSVAEATVDIRNQFVRKVYSILTVQLVATAALSSISFFSDAYKSWIQSHPGLVWASVCQLTHSHPTPFVANLPTYAHSLQTKENRFS